MGLLACTALAIAVLLLRAALALYVCGISRSKNAAGGFFRILIEACCAILIFCTLGAAIFTGNLHAIYDAQGLIGAPLFLMTAIVLLASGTITAATIERSRPIVIVAGSIIVAGIITPLAWRWSTGAGWLREFGFIDLAGASYIHLAGGLAAATAAWFVGPRDGKYHRDGSTSIILGHSVPLASTGILLMFIAWPAYIAGSILLRWQTEAIFDSSAASAIVNTLIAGSAAACASTLYCQTRYRKLDIFLIYSGLLGGLVAITAGADQFNLLETILIGIIAGLVAPYAVNATDMILRIDDASGLATVQVTGAIIGIFAVPLFAPATLALHLHRILSQTVGLLTIAALALTVSAATFAGLRATVGLRSKPADEQDGLDLAEHDLNAHPDFQQTMIKSYHLREV
jgi:Amt family ammonium transporter